MVHMTGNEIRWQANISRIILIHKLPLQLAMLSLGLALAAQGTGLGLTTQGH